MTRAVRIAALCLAVALMAGCVEFLDLLEITAYEESDDPRVKKTGEVLREIEEERQVRNALDLFAETGDPRYLEDARAIRPSDTALKAYDLLLAQRSGDPAAIRAAKEALTLAEAQRLNSIPGDDQVFTAEHIRRNVLGEILVAQTNLLGGSLNEDWSPPPPDAPPEQHALYQDYCETRRQIQSPPYNDDLHYIPLPPCDLGGQVAVETEQLSPGD